MDIDRSELLAVFSSHVGSLCLIDLMYAVSDFVSIIV